MTPLRRLISYLLRHKKSLALGGLCVAGSAIFSLTKPWIVGSAVNELAKSVNRAVLIRYGAMLVGASAIEGLFLYLQRWIIIGASRRIEYEIRNDFFQHLEKLPLRYYHGQRTGDLMSRATNDLSSVRMLIGPAVMYTASSLFVVTGSFIMMTRIDHAMALISLIALPIVAGLVKIFGQQIHLRFKAVQDYFGDISARVQENLAGVRVVRAFGQEQNEIDTFKRMNHEYVERNRSLIKLTATFYPALHGVIGIMFGIVFFLGSRKMISGGMNIGSFVAFQFYLGRMIWPLIAIGWVINLVQRGMASMVRLDEVLRVEPDVSVEPPAISTTPKGDIDIRNLTYTYDTHPVLSNVSLSVRHGETVGIVGRTGSGKSTLLSLITRTFEPPPQAIFIDGQPVETIPLRQLREWIGVVPQETFLFSESIADNIRFGRAEATADDVRTSAEEAGLSGDVATFAQGLETVIGERGITLSGGQKQRTAIARALIRNPLILILDDSLSAVDTATEERILRALREIRKGRTVLIVSHRVSSVKDADQIVVLDTGRIVERGTHDSLLAHDGYYADLYRRQTIEEELEEIA
ncbi:MAG: ABC transporter ATP-binding protein/permease [Acidobacteriota bacterium]|nr:ABC transporter ATP-binding protein/permease [Acidobacteriota bacterium]